MRRAALLALALCPVVATAACGRLTREVKLVAEPAARVEELWQEPVDIARRDLLHGAGGSELMPRSRTFEFVARDTSGWSPGFDVRSADGADWSVKLGPEAQSEVVASRILWAIGFHQPPTYYIDRWMLTGVETGSQEPGRFRPSRPGTVVADWSWYENPFVGARPFGGLIVVNVMLNTWDWKTSNNKVYELAEPRTIAGIYRDVIEAVTLADVRWTCTLLSRLSDDQWRDAFRAGGYNSEQTARYVAKMKAKIAQGLAVTAG